MSFVDLQLDQAISRGATGFPDFEPVIIAQGDSGIERREGTRAKGLGLWTISYNGQEPAVWKAFLDHYYLVGGRLHSWPMKDWFDFTCTTAESYLLPIDATHWQLCKRRTRGAYTYDQVIVLPILSTVAVTGGGTYSVSRTTGILTKSGGASPTAFSCEFDKLCRFDARIEQTLEHRRPNGEVIATATGVAVREIPLSSA